MKLGPLSAAAARMLARIAARPQTQPWWEIRDAADGVPEVLIYDEIGFFGVDSATFVSEIDDIVAPVIRVRINSPGGSVFAGMAIYNALKRHPATIEAHVDGVAASAASFILMAGDRIVMNEGSFIMIHEAWTIAIGNAADMREMADFLDKITGEIAAIYARRTGLDRADIDEMMAAETWMTADEAVDAGFADESAARAAETENRFDLSIFQKVPAPAAERFGGRKGSPWRTPREFEQHLRDAGCSVAAARKICADGFKTPDRRDDAGSPELNQLAAALRARCDILH